jgi:adenine phosphoribosyltransferase
MDPRLELLREHIRDVPDFPKPGILFRDITPLLGSPAAFNCAVELFAERYRERRVKHIVAIESRGFLFAAPLALALRVPLHLVRKPGKLPWQCERVSYTLEYGQNSLEIQQDDVPKSARVLVMDDLLATGGTAAAAARLVRGQGATVVELAFVIELTALQGRRQLDGAPTFALLEL